MECIFDVDVKEPDSIDLLFHPSVKFRLKQLNMTPGCMTNDEIDFQINELIKNVEKLRKTVKKKLKDAKSRHNEIVSVGKHHH